MPSNAINKAADYLRQHQSRYPPSVLKAQLEKAGYPHEVIKQAMIEIFGSEEKKDEGDSETGFWNFTHRKHYTSFRAKITDVIFGFFAAIVIDAVVLGVLMRIILGNMLGYSFPSTLLAYALWGVIIFYLWNRRRYIVIGSLIEWVVNLLVGGSLNGGIIWNVLSPFS